MKNKSMGAFIMDLVKLKDEAGRLGLFKTMHKLDAAVKEVGWELESILTKQLRKKNGKNHKRDAKKCST